MYNIIILEKKWISHIYGEAKGVVKFGSKNVYNRYLTLDIPVIMKYVYNRYLTLDIPVFMKYVYNRYLTLDIPVFMNDSIEC